jgi:hypothetical protein
MWKKSSGPYAVFKSRLILYNFCCTHFSYSYTSHTVYTHDYIHIQYIYILNFDIARSDISKFLSLHFWGGFVCIVRDTTRWQKFAR